MLQPPASDLLRDHDHPLSGPCFLTLCCLDARHLFGWVEDGRVLNNPLGELAGELWQEQVQRFPDLVLDSWTVMPNHLHMLLSFDPNCRQLPLSVPRIIENYRSGLTSLARQRGLLRQSQLFQDAYHDHLVRSNAALERIRDYIRTNPQRWHLDRENPKRTGEDEFYAWLQDEEAAAAASTDSPDPRNLTFEI